MVDIVGKRRTFFIPSALAVAASVAALIVFGLKPSIDFTGGSLLEISFTGERPPAEAVRSLAAQSGLDGALVQSSGDKGYLLKTRFISEEEHQALLAALRREYENDESYVLEDRVETIGPAVSSHLKNRSIKAAVAVLVAIVAYVAYAFRKVSKPVQSWKYGITAIIAVVHDVIITMGVFAVLGRYAGVEVDIPFIVALLTTFGYSVNDTIVVFDRIRENLIRHSGKDFGEVVNMGINETFQRSINTSLTTLLVLFALFFFGGATIHYFSLALIIGISAGTYSSIFVASPLLFEWYRASK